jgi:hypothetical protein
MRGKSVVFGQIVRPSNSFVVNLQHVLYRTGCVPLILSAVWELIVAKRNLRVTKWLGTVPAVGVCTLCNREFKVPMSGMKRVADAQESLRVQFAEHKCKGETDETPPSH